MNVSGLYEQSGVDSTLDVNGTLKAGDVSIALGSLVQGTGKIIADGNVILDGSTSPGTSPGTLTFDADEVVFGDNHGLFMEISGTSPGLEHDVLDVIGDLELGGSLILRFIDDFAPLGVTGLPVHTLFGRTPGLMRPILGLAATPHPQGRRMS